MYEYSPFSNNSGRAETKAKLWALPVAVLILLLPLLAPTPAAALPAGFQEYYVLGSEEQIYNMFDVIDTDEIGSPGAISSNQMRSIVTVVATADNQVFYYDHWEDGYEADILNPTQDSTEVYGAAPDTPLGVGDILSLKSDGSGSGINAVVPVNPRGTDIRYDGGDHVVSTGGPVDLAHAMWPEDGTWIGGAWEVYSIQAWSESFSYRIPVGVNTGSADFVYAWLQVEALYDNTTVTIDNATDTINVVLDKGQTYSSMGYVDSQPSTPITVIEGTTVSSDQQTQIGLITGGHGTFQTRFYVMIPDLMWGTEYIAAIPRTTAGEETEIYLYNPNDHSIDVETHDANGHDSVTIPAGGVVAYSDEVGDYVPSGSSVRLNSDDTFWGLVSADASDTGYDWGFSLIPSVFLKADYFACWAPGNVLDPVTSGVNASPVWVSPAADDTTFYVDYGPVDGDVDETFTIDAMETRRIFDPDHDNTGMHIWATGIFVPVWGVDPASNESGDGYLDLGYTVLPLHQGWLEPVMSLEKTADTEILPVGGGQVTFFLQAETHGPAPVTNIDITDTLPISWTYKPGSTIVTYADGSKGYPDPAISGQTLFWNLSHEMYSNEPLLLQFDAQIQTRGSVGTRHFDGFESNGYSGGTGGWLDNWIEVGSNPGDIQIVDDTDVVPYSGDRQLRIVNDRQTMYREIDLSDFSRPILRFKRYFWELNGDDETFGVDISVDDGLSYTSVLSWTDAAADRIDQEVWVQEEADLSSYITSTARIRFRGISDCRSNDYLFLDDVEVYDMVVVNENEGLVSGQYRDHSFNATDTAVVYLSALSIEKAVDKSTVDVGETLLYTLTCQNSGGITTTGTYINDTIPWGTTFRDASSGGTYISSSNAVSWTIGEVGPAETAWVTFTVEVDDDTPDGTVIENSGRVNSDETNLINSNTVETTALAPDLDVTKSGPANASEGSVITYTIQYVNSGGMAATGVVISDSIPLSTTYEADSMEINTGSGWGSLSDSPGDDAGTYHGAANAIVIQPGATPGTLVAGESGMIRFRAQVASSVPGGTSIINRATVDRDGDDPWNTPLVATAIRDLTIAKAADQTVAVAGDVIEYTLTYGNHGAITETNVYIYDTMPAHSNYVLGTATGAGLTVEFSFDHRGTWTTTVPSDPTQVTDLRWSRDELPAGMTGLTAGFHVQLEEELPGDVTLSNFATITSAVSGPIYSNIVDVTTIDLVIYKSASSSCAFPGNTITYTIIYGNNGSANATGVAITDTLPISTSYVAGSIAGNGADDTGNPILVWNVGTVPAGATGLQVSYAVTVDPGAAPGTDIANTALIANALDSATSNENKVIVASAGLSIGPSNEEWGYPGQPMTYSHSIVNTGSVTDTVEITFSHSLRPTTTTTLYHDLDGDGVRDPGDPVITTATEALKAGEEYDILLILTIPAEASGNDVNQTTITATSTLSPELTSKTVDTTHVHLVALDINKTAMPTLPVAPETAITYTLAFTNSGSATLNSVVITDSVPVSVTHSSLNVTSSGAAIIAIGGTSYVWEVANLPSGEGGVITVTGVLSDSLPSRTFTNTVTITGEVAGAGRASDSHAASITVDADAPTVPGLDTPADGTATDDTTPTFDWNPATDNGDAGVAGYNIQIGSNVYTVTAPTTAFTPTALADGTYTWTVRSFDAAGNYSAYAATRTLIVDTIAPDTSITVEPPNPDNDATPTFQFNGSDPGGSGVASYECQVDGGGWFTCTSPYTTTSLSDGSHTFEVRATDLAANTDATPASYTWTIDTTAPDAPKLSSPADGTVTSTNQLTLTWQASAGAVGYLVNLNGSVVDVGNVTTTTTGVLSSGTYTWTVAAYDGLYNTSAYTDVWSFTVTLPTQADVSIIKGVAPGAADPGESITYTLTFTNKGPGTATGVVITDSVPVSVTQTGVFSQGVAITPISSGYVWSVEDLSPGQVGTITITGVLSEPLPVGTFTNTASIATNTADTNPGNNQSSAEVTVQNVTPALNDATWNVAEDAVNGTSVGTVVGTDANGDTLTYSITAGNADGVFSIHDSTDQITVEDNTTLDYETTPQYVLTVEASDGTLTGTAAITINVDDLNEYTLTINIVGSGSVASDPVQPLYNHGDVVTLTADADIGWTFVSWSGGATGSDNPITITMDGDKSVTATFSQDEYNLTLNIVGSGSVHAEPVGPYHHGDTVTLTATPDTGWTFVSWSGAATGSDNPTTITMDSDKSVTATFSQDGTAGVNVAPSTVNVEEGGITDTYSVSLNSQPTDTVTVTIVTDDQVTVTPSSLTFDATNWDTAQQVTVTAVDDEEIEGPHTSAISHEATSADSNYDGLTIADVTANITDNDPISPPVSVQFDSSSYTVKETADTATITVVLSAAATKPVTVTYATHDGTATDGSDYTATSGTLRFDVGHTCQTFTVPIFGDTRPEDDETVHLTLSVPVNATLGARSTATLTIENNAFYLPIIARNHGQ
jgi:uncharacterized repeat protein (TIGR01451 family)/uncharacterized repeat protein (TIGR02543 family)